MIKMQGKDILKVKHDAIHFTLDEWGDVKDLRRSFYDPDFESSIIECDLISIDKNGEMDLHNTSRLPVGEDETYDMYVLEKHEVKQLAEYFQKLYEKM